METIFETSLHFMESDLKNKLLAEMKKRGIKIPAFAKQTGIPKDRIYKWFSEGTTPKADDYLIIEKWLNRNTSTNVDIEQLAQAELIDNYEMIAMKAVVEQLIIEIAKLKSKIYQIAPGEALDEIEKITEIAVKKAEKVYKETVKLRGENRP